MVRTLIIGKKLLDSDREHEMFFPKLGKEILLIVDGELIAYHNITEIHWKYSGSDSLALESDVHGTGSTQKIDKITFCMAVVDSTGMHKEYRELL